MCAFGPAYAVPMRPVRSAMFVSTSVAHIFPHAPRRPLQNTVESVLLFCAMLVAIAGIMFNSDQLNPADDSGQVRQAALW